MKLARDLWRRGPLYQKFVSLEPIDRATALIVLALFSAFLASSSAIVRLGVIG